MLRLFIMETAKLVTIENNFLCTCAKFIRIIYQRDFYSFVSYFLHVVRDENMN